MSTRRPRSDPPAALVEAMQGLAFWLGYQHRLFPNHNLVEGALVSEMYRLLERHIDKELIVIAECAYSRLCQKGGSRKKLVKAGERADIVVAAATNDPKGERGIKTRNILHGVAYVLEVKRSTSSAELIKDDIQRLHKCLTMAESEARAFLVLVSQAGRPRAIRGFGELVGSTGLASRSVRSLPNSPDGSILVRVRRVCKASASFKPKSEQSAHYVTLIEVLKS